MLYELTIEEYLREKYHSVKNDIPPITVKEIKKLTSVWVREYKNMRRILNITTPEIIRYPSCDVN